MSDVSGLDIENPIVPSATAGLEAFSQITELVEGAITGIPAPIRKNAVSAFSRLCTAATDFPVNWLLGKAGELTGC